ncbi:hypothetical protein [Profundibacter sp.]
MELIIGLLSGAVGGGLGAKILGMLGAGGMAAGGGVLLAVVGMVKKMMAK